MTLGDINLVNQVLEYWEIRKMSHSMELYIRIYVILCVAVIRIRQKCDQKRDGRIQKTCPKKFFGFIFYNMETTFKCTQTLKLNY